MDKKEHIISSINRVFKGDCTKPLRYTASSWNAKMAAVRYFIYVSHLGYDEVAELLNSDRNEVMFCLVHGDTLIRNVKWRDTFRKLEGLIEETEEV